MARANNLPILAIELLTYLAANQGQPIRRVAIAAYLTANTTTGATVTEMDVSEITIYIRETIPDVPIVSSTAGLMLTMAWEPNRRYALRKIRTVITIERRLDRGHVQPMLREQQRQAAAGNAPTFSQQEEFLLRQSSLGLQQSQQQLTLLEQALVI